MFSIRQYILAGNATFTIEGKTRHLTYRCRRKENQDGHVHFIDAMVGRDNEKEYSFLGTIFADGGFRRSYKSTVKATDVKATGFAWFWERVDNPPDCVTFHPSKKCCRCGRKLTTPESTRLGIGPECLGKMGEIKGRGTTDDQNP